MNKKMKSKFLKTIEPYVNSYYHKDHIVYEIKKMKYFEFIHNADIEFYIQYVLENYDDETFGRFFYAIYEIGLGASTAALRICQNHAWYSGRRDKERILEELFKSGHLYAETFDEEVKKCVEDVIEIETNYINECQKKALRYETYCDNCSPR